MWDTILPVVFRIGAYIAIAVAAWWAWYHFIANPYIAEGVAQEKPRTVAALARAETAEGANARLQQDLVAVKLKIKEANDTIDGLHADQAAQLAASTKLLNAAKAREKSLKAEIASLAAASHGPPAPTPEEACREATATLSDLAAQRVRQ